MASETPKLKVRIINPDQILYEGEADYLMIPSKHGMLGLMPSHTPMFAEIRTGDIHMKVGTGAEQTFPVISGVAKIKDNEVMILIGA